MLLPHPVGEGRYPFGSSTLKDELLIAQTCGKAQATVKDPEIPWHVPFPLGDGFIYLCHRALGSCKFSEVVGIVLVLPCKLTVA